MWYKLTLGYVEHIWFVEDVKYNIFCNGIYYYRDGKCGLNEAPLIFDSKWTKEPCSAKELALIQKLKLELL